MIFSKRCELQAKVEEWLTKNGVDRSVLNVVTAIDAIGMLAPTLGELPVSVPIEALRIADSLNVPVSSLSDARKKSIPEMTKEEVIDWAFAKVNVAQDQAEWAMALAERVLNRKDGSGSGADRCENRDYGGRRQPAQFPGKRGRSRGTDLNSQGKHGIDQEGRRDGTIAYTHEANLTRSGEPAPARCCHPYNWTKAEPRAEILPEPVLRRSVPDGVAMKSLGVDQKRARKVWILGSGSGEDGNEWQLLGIYSTYSEAVDAGNRYKNDPRRKSWADFNQPYEATVDSDEMFG